MVWFFENGALDAPGKEKEKQEDERTVMKRRLLTGLVVAGLAIGGTAVSLLAQNGPGQGRNGFGYGGPPKSAEERAARQAACIERNGGVCPNGGPRADCPRRGMGPRNGAGQGWRRGLRNGTGPRSAKGTCPMIKPAQKQK
jgi:hypothetical protein